MIVDFQGIVKDINGQPIPLNGQPATLGMICAAALYVEPVRRMDPRAKYFRHCLAKQCINNGRVEIDPSTVTHLMDAVGEAFPISVMGPTWDALAGESNDIAPAPMPDATGGVIVLRAKG